MSLHLNFAKNIVVLRKVKKITQEELAHEAGIQRSYMSGIEGGNRNPTLAIVEKIAAVLKVDPVELLSPDNDD